MKRYRKVMGLAIVLVALAVAINALAFSSAKVHNATTLTIKATKDAAVGIDAITSGEGTGFTVSGTSTGAMTLDIDDVMQPNSEYRFSKVFQITKGSTADITLLAPTITAGTGFDLGTGGDVLLVLAGADETVAANLIGGANAKSLDGTTTAIEVDIIVKVGADAPVSNTPQDLTITINATQANNP